MLELHVIIEKEAELYSALCLELNIASQGKTIKEAENNIREAIELYFEDVYDAGDEKDFIPRPAPVSEWLKYFTREADHLKNRLRAGHLRTKLREVVVG